MSKLPLAQNESETTQLRAIVRGRVQGVGFRFFVLGEARRLGLGGAVWNRADGAVELEAQGPRAALEQLLAAAGRGPAFSRVDSVQADWEARFPPADGFEVRR